MNRQSTPVELDRSVLPYVLLYSSRLNMLALERALISLRNSDGSVRLENGAVRSELKYRVAVTFQLAVELQLSDPEVIAWTEEDQDGLRKQMAIDAAYYASERWEAANATGQFGLPGAASSRSAALDEDEFFRFLSKRSQLHEEESGKGIEHSPPPARSEQLRLLAIARAVLGMLRPHFKRSLWQELIHSRGAPALQTPHPAALDALLAEENSLIDEYGLWRLSSRDTMFTSNEGLQFADEIRAFQSVLIASIGAERLISRDSLEFLARSAEGIQLLPTSPAVSYVERAMRSVRQRLRLDEDGADIQNRADVGYLQDFVLLLRKNQRTIFTAFLVATLLASSSGKGAWRFPTADRTQRALENLAEGLQFGQKTTPIIGRALRRFIPQFLKLLGPSDEVAADLKIPVSMGFDEFLVRSEQVARKAADMSLSFLDASWEDAKERNLTYIEDGQLLDASAAEIVSRTIEVGPYQSLGLSIPSNGTAEWSSVFHQMLVAGPLGVPWLSAVALWHLGMRHMGKSEALEMLRLHSPSNELSLERNGVLVRLLSAVSPSPTFAGTSIVIRGHDSNLNESAGNEEEDGAFLLRYKHLQFAFLAMEFEDLLDKVPDFLKICPRPLTIKFDGTVDDRTAELLERTVRYRQGSKDDSVVEKVQRILRAAGPKSFVSRRLYFR